MAERLASLYVSISYVPMQKTIFKDAAAALSCLPPFCFVNGYNTDCCFVDSVVYTLNCQFHIPLKS